ncbi:MAG: hypothetical protein IV106_03935 [Pseudomonas umsongensis]|nr:hypothetical protein [Pseudomonas umsongensis]
MADAHAAGALNLVESDHAMKPTLLLLSRLPDSFNIRLREHFDCHSYSLLNEKDWQSSGFASPGVRYEHCVYGAHAKG